MMSTDTTIAEIASRAGVSIATISRVLSPSGHPVSEKTRRRVLDVACDLDYHPSAAARALSTRRTWALGIAVPDLANPYYAEIVHAIEDAARAAGYTVLFTDFHRDSRRLRAGLDLFRSQRVDGVVLAGGGSDEAADLGVLTRAGIPAVLIGRHEDGVPAVRVDNVQAGRLAAEHLVAHAHARISFISGPAQLTTVQDRLQGFQGVCERAGTVLDVEPGDFDPRSGYEGMRRILARRPRASAVCAANDHMAIGAMAACADAGLTIPRDLALMGFDDIPLASYVRPALTTIAIPTRELGSQAARLLLSLIDGSQVPAVTWVDIQLIKRDSTANGGNV